MRGAVASAGATALSIVVVSGAAAVAAVLLAQKFGRNAETDGLLAAYGVYLVISLAAQSLRIVVVPALTRAGANGRLAAETVGYAVVLAAFSLLAVVGTVAFSEPLAAAIAGGLPDEAQDACADALVWLVPAGCAHLLAALLASALAARDSYGVAAVGYAAGAVAGLVAFAALADEHGVVSLAWGLALNGAIAVAVPLAALFAAGPRALRGSVVQGWPRRLSELARGTAVPIALQGLYLISLRLAADLGVGEVTSFSYAFLIASVLVAATASSLGLVSSAPLTRRGVAAEAAAAHVVHSSWLSMAVIVAGAGVFALAGGTVAEALLGDAFSGEAGRDLGRLVVALAPWMLASVAFTVTFPLLFVVRRSRVALPLALGLPALQVAVGLALRELWGLPGIALALALTTLVGVALLMASLSPRMLALGAAGLGRLSLFQGTLAALSFGVLSLVLGGIPAALLGLVAYAALLALLRPRGLTEAWSYMRALH